MKNQSAHGFNNSAFTLIEHLTGRSHLCGNRTDGKGEKHSPVHGQVKQYCFTCPRTGEAVLLHLD